MYASILLTQLLMYIMVRFLILSIFRAYKQVENQACYIYLLAANTAVLYTLLTQQVVW